MLTKPIATDKLVEIEKLTSDYLRIANEYIDIKMHKKYSHSKVVCAVCFSTEYYWADDVDEDIAICKGCNREIEILDDTPTFKDTDRVNMSERYTYSCEAHYEEAMNCYEGKQHSDNLPPIVDFVRSQMDQHNLKPSTITKDKWLFVLP